MRLVYAIVALLCTAFALTAADRPIDPAVAWAWSVPLPSKVAAPAVKTLCGCAVTRECLCFESNCSCVACGRGAAPKAPKAVSSTGATIQRTLVRPVVDPSSQSTARTGMERTTTDVPLMGLSGGTSGCANGKCETSTSRGFFRRR